jgi:tetratricopeptide (TPR) repeat protein
MRNLVCLGVLFTLANCGPAQPPPPQTPPLQAPPPPVTPAPAAAAPAPKPAKKVLKHAATTRSAVAAAALEKGTALLDDVRYAEAITQFKKAIDADPRFAYAHAYLGMNTSGMEGQKLLEKAAQLAADLPEADRLLIEAWLAARKGDTATYRAKLDRVAALVPDDWMVQEALGHWAFGQRDFAAAVAAYEKAIALNPKAPSSYNNLGYVHALQGRYEEGIAALNKYLTLRPQDANGYDSLAEIMLNAGKLDDAEATFKKAVEVLPTFDPALQGHAFVRAARGDYKGACDLLAKSRQLAKRAEDRLDRDLDVAWLKLAEGKKADAFKALDAAEKEARAQKLPYPAGLAFDRGLFYYVLGKYADAAKHLQIVIDKAAAPELSGAERRDSNNWALVWLTAAQVRAGKVKQAEKTLAGVEAAAKKLADQPYFQKNGLGFARAMVAWGKKDPKKAIADLSECAADNFWCSWHRSEVQQKVDKAGAGATRKAVLDKPLRDRTWPIIRAKLKK